MAGSKKNNKLRKSFFFFEFRLKCFKYMLYNINLDNVMYKNDLLFLLNYCFTSHHLNYRIVNYCLITGRSRSVCRFFRLSRYKLKELGSFGLLYGLTKSSW